MLCAVHIEETLRPMLVAQPHDQRIYEQHIAPWLPPEVIDIHTHIGLREYWGPVSDARRAEMWPMEIADSQSWEELEQAFAVMLPSVQTRALCFGWVYREVDIEANNRYVWSGRHRDCCAGTLLVSHPDWPAERIDEALASGWLGLKPYPDLAPGGYGDCSIADFLPDSHLSVLDRYGGLLMLHLPRAGRLADPDNIRELLDMRQRFPSVRIIVAHIGRAYGMPNAQSGLKHFRDTDIVFDTAAHLNSDVFALALETIGPQRVLYGSDLPVMIMRGFREHDGDRYINWTNGDYSWNTRRKPPETEAGYTWFLYEELLALIRAFERSGLTSADAADVFYGNAIRLLTAARSAQEVAP